VILTTGRRRYRNHSDIAGECRVSRELNGYMLSFKTIIILVGMALPLVYCDVRASAQGSEPLTITVSSPSALFSPANWSGDSGRGGSLYRQTWVPGAWVKFYWSDSSDAPTAKLLITYSGQDGSISYYADGNFSDNIPVDSTGGITVDGLSGIGRHELDVYIRSGPQVSRWDLTSSWRVAGLTLDDTATPEPAPALRPWVLEIGDSITEGIAANNGDNDNLVDYSFLTGQALDQAGYDYAVSACGWSGFLCDGDDTQDVPAYYNIINGAYDETSSRWDKIDSNTSLLSADNDISAYGAVDTPPVMITINYGTNEALRLPSFKYLPVSIVGTLTALRRAAPAAWIVVYVPFNLYSKIVYNNGPTVVNLLKNAVAVYRASHPRDLKVVLVDYGPKFSQTVVSAGGGAIHPNLIGHELIAARTIATVIGILSAHGGH
jgi:hypothetical protein